MTSPRSSILKNRRVLIWPTLLLLCAVAVAPLLRGVSPCTHDGAFHYYRVVAMRHALKQGLLYTRWLPDLAFGYGYPFFNYRAPIPYYLALELFLTGMALPLALDLVYVLSITGCAVGAYLLARDLFGPMPAVVAAVAYAYAPYQFLDALLRGNAPESVALALFPFILWAFRRLALHGGRGWFLAATGLLATLYLSHNISSLLFTPFLLAYLLLLAWIYREDGHWTWVALALVLALGMSAFLWAPALGEKRFVQLNMSRTTRNNDFHYNFLGLREILAPPEPVDTALMNPPMEVHLGLVPALLALLGLGVGWARSRGRERRASLIFFAASAFVFIFMSTQASLWLWEHVPLLPFVQFPWRFVGRAALPVALLAGCLFATDRESEPSPLFAYLSPLVVCLLIVVALPSTYPPLGYCPTKAHPTVEDVHRYERQSKLVGVDPEGSYFPVWVERRPSGSPLEEQYASGGPIARFDETSLPAGAAVLESDYGPNRARLVVDSPNPFRARYLTFYFPGWRISIDGEPIELTPTDPEGLISFDVPAGRHTIRIHFGRTRLRTAADAVSVASLLTLLALAIWAPGLKKVSDSLSSPPTSTSQRPFIPMILALVAVLLLILRLAIVDRVESPFRRPSIEGVEVPAHASHTLTQPYADGMVLLGYDWSAIEIPSDGALRIDLYWTAREQPTRRYQSVVQLIGPEGQLWSPQASYRPRGYHRPLPTTTWGPGRYALDSHVVEPLVGTPPGTYRIVVTVFDRETLAPLSVLNEAGAPAAPSLTLGELQLNRPKDAVEPSVENRLDQPLGPLTLLSASFDREQAAPGDSIALTTLWRADRELTQELTLGLSLVDAEGITVAEYDFPLVAAWHPASAWRVEDVWRGQHRLRLPAGLEGGEYTWRLSLYPIDQSVDLPSPVQVTAYERIYTAPPMETEIDTRLGDAVILVGVDLEPRPLKVQAGETITATLVWRAEETPTKSYHVFFHLLDPEGRLVAQSDGVPANWSRPTTGWLPGEYVIDRRAFTVPSEAPAGDYTLQVGLYVPDEERLTTSDGEDAVRLATVSVEGP